MNYQREEEKMSKFLKQKVKNGWMDRLTLANEGGPTGGPRIFNSHEFDEPINDGVYVIGSTCPEEVTLTLNGKKVDLWEWEPADEAKEWLLFFRLINGNVEKLTFFDICLWAKHGVFPKDTITKTEDENENKSI